MCLWATLFSFNRPQYRPNDRLSGNHHSSVARIALIGVWEVLKRIIKVLKQVRDSFNTATH